MKVNLFLITFHSENIFCNVSVPDKNKYFMKNKNMSFANYFFRKNKIFLFQKNIASQKFFSQCK